MRPSSAAKPTEAVESQKVGEGAERKGKMASSSTRGTLIGIGAVLIVAGFLFSTLVCGVGVIFVILGVVMWPRGEDEWRPPPTRATDEAPVHRAVWKPTYAAKRRRKH